jgi:Xaa-Pro aminopeptidase
MVKDGVALVEAISEIKTRIEEHVRTTEIDVSRILAKHRKMQENYFSDSFETISAYGPNGAVVHYSPKEEDCAEVGTDSLLLIDSGGNYYDGTTDITRVFAFGVPTAEQKRDYTAVLKGHIALASARFLKGTRGGELDVLAHQHLWREGLDYGHGTGHGVGFFLSVHEGPQKISRTGNTLAVLLEGMLLSDEPGVYRAGVHGIRIENMLQVVADGRSEFGEFLRFETLTLFPYEPRLIDKTMLDEKEIAWVNNYHEKVRTEILPRLFSPKAKDWLKEVTEKL